MQKHLSVSVFGRVQGVFFRKFTKEEADRLGLKGTVENRPDGSVQIEAEGPEEALNTFLIWLHSGPEMAEVDRIEISEGEFQDCTDFSILR